MTNIRMQLVLRNVVQDLKDSVDDWIAEESGDPSGLYIVTFTGLAFDLNNIVVPAIATLNGIRVWIGSLHIDIPMTIINLMPPFSLMQLLGIVLDIKVPGSEYWLYGGPVREGVWPPKTGTDPSFSETQYYTAEDTLLDGFGLTLILAIGYALSQVGLMSLVQRFMKRALSRNTMTETQQIVQIINILNSTGGVVENVNSIKTSVGTFTGGDTIQSVMATLNTLTNAIKTVIDKVNVQVLTDSGDDILTKVDNILTEVGLDPETLDSKVQQVVDKLNRSVYV